jgi:serine/threonine-protein kinase
MNLTGLIGTPATLGKYRIVLELGRGGMSDVYLAVARAGVPDFNKVHVIKCMRPQLFEEAEFLAMFLDEARLAARLHHPNVVQTFEAGQEGEFCYLVMEYLEGETFQRVLSRSRRGRSMPLALQLRVLQGVLAGLHYAHELCDYGGRPLGVVHRDVSPHNVFLTYDGQVKLVDFGIAKTAAASVETRTGVVKGKVTYMAPEQARGRPVDRRADLYGVGVMLWEALAGRRLWGKIHEHQVLQLLAEGHTPSLEEACPGVPAPLRQICARAMAHEPCDRYATAEEMRAALESYAEAAGVRTDDAALGGYVRDVFAERRAATRAALEAQLRRLNDEPSNPGFATGSWPSAGAPSSRAFGASSLPPSSLQPAVGDAFVAGARPPGATGVTRSVTTAAAAAAPGEPGAGPGGGRGRTFVVAAAAGACGAALALAELLRAPLPAAAPAVAPPSAPAPLAPAALASTTFVDVRIAANPPHAKLYYDETPLPSNPFVGRFVRDGRSHRVRGEAEGFEAEQGWVSLSGPAVDLDLKLAPRPAERPKERERRGAGAAPTPRAHAPAFEDALAVPRPNGRRPEAPALPAEDPWDRRKR